MGKQYRPRRKRRRLKLYIARSKARRREAAQKAKHRS